MESCLALSFEKMYVYKIVQPTGTCMSQIPTNKKGREGGDVIIIIVEWFK